MPQHTPSPWIFDGQHVDAKRAGHKNGICELLLTGDPDVDEQVRADGHLIAAAPELLEACQSAQTLLAAYGNPQSGTTQLVLRILANAIAAATTSRT